MIAWRDRDIRRSADEYRSSINQSIPAIRRELIELGCFKKLMISPPPAVGGLLYRNVDPLEIFFDPPYGGAARIVGIVVDMLDQAIGILRSGSVPEPMPADAVVEAEPSFQEGYAFIAMPIDPADPALLDVLDAIKTGCGDCGIHAERVDEVEANSRITDRIVESIRRAEFVIVDLTGGRPNVFWEAGFAHALGKEPVYIARAGTKLEFDIKDYPVIMFNNLTGLKAGLKRRLEALMADRPNRSRK